MTTHEYYHSQMNVPFNASSMRGEVPLEEDENHSIRQQQRERSGSTDTLEYHDLPISDQHDHTNRFQQVKDILGKIFKYSLGNRRLNMYLYTMMKVSVTLHLTLRTILFFLLS